MAGESHGGTYFPNAVIILYKKNKELEVDPMPRTIKINLASIILANGWRNPPERYSSIPDWICEGPYALFKPESCECVDLRQSAACCHKAVEFYYKFDTNVSCILAEVSCLCAQGLVISGPYSCHVKYLEG